MNQSNHVTYGILRSQPVAAPIVVLLSFHEKTCLIRRFVGAMLVSEVGLKLICQPAIHIGYLY